MKEYEIEISRSQRNLDMDLPGELIFGVPGPKGDPGYSPVRGVDYWTEEDTASIKAYIDDVILQKIPDINLEDTVLRIK